MIIYLNKVNWFLPVFMSFGTCSNETKLGGSVGFPRTWSPALSATMPGSTAWVIAPESLTCAYIRTKFHSHFLRRSCLNFPLSDGALHLPSRISVRSRGSSWRSVTAGWGSSHHAPSSCGFTSSAPSQETWGKEHAQTHRLSDLYELLQYSSWVINALKAYDTAQGYGNRQVCEGQMSKRARAALHRTEKNMFSFFRRIPLGWLSS